MSFELKVPLGGELGSPATHLFPSPFLGTCVIYKCTIKNTCSGVFGLCMCPPTKNLILVMVFWGVVVL